MVLSIPKLMSEDILSHCAVCYARHRVDHGCETGWGIVTDVRPTIAQHDDISICQQLLHLCYQPVSKFRSTILLKDMRDAASWGVHNLSLEEVLV
jgi:hypothetical protein